jgi:putative glutathione S-transferase
MLVDGRWVQNWDPVQAKDEKGRFLRQVSSFRNWVTPDGSPGPTGEGGFPAEAGRYHLYVALICPWASRTLIARSLKGLKRAVSVSVVDPTLSEGGWRFPETETDGATADVINGAAYMHEIYTRVDPAFTGRATVPVLWDKHRGTIVNNESADILRMFNSGFGALADPAIDLYPEALREEIDALNAHIYPRLNNGVYRAGFGTTQLAYDEAVADVFSTLDALETRMEGQRFLVGDRLTETDIRAFVTLVRFDAAYHGIFKCNLRRLADYPNLSRFVETMLGLPGVAETVSIDHIKRGYYSIRKLNPYGVVPAGPILSFEHLLASVSV